MWNHAKKSNVVRGLIGSLVLLAVLTLSMRYQNVIYANSGGSVTYYDLTLCSPTGGSITNDPAGTTFVENTVVTLTAVPNAGYAFDEWTGAVSGSANPTTVTMSADRSVCATFIVDNTAPVITLLGNATVAVECGASYTDAGATASDNNDGDITAQIVVGGDTVDADTPGVYVITYDVSDAAQNSATQVTRTVTVSDTTAPVITLLGDNPMTVYQGTSYVEPGATATDGCDGDLTGDIVIGGDTVLPATLGTYVVTYDVEDDAENDAVQVTRTVNVVVDDVVPVISLLGENPQIVSYGGSYTDPGATAIDNVDGDISGSIVVSGDSVDVNTLGNYTVLYDVEDAQGNDAVQVSRTVSVEDTTKPVITLVGGELLHVDYGTTYSDPGATALDNIDGDLTSSIVVGGDTVNTGVIGVYGVTYSVSDTAGNAAEKLRPVYVEDNEAPVITLTGDNPMTVTYQGTYTDPGATATDNYDGDISGSIVVSGDTVDPNTPGNYLVRYDVGDTEGNEALQVIRTVNVPTPDPKTLTVTGPSNGDIVLTPPDPAVVVEDGDPDHDEDYVYGTPVSVQANPASGFIFGAWGGDLTGEGGATRWTEGFDDTSLDPSWSVDSGTWAEDVSGYLTVAAESGVTPAISRPQTQADLAIHYAYQRVSGTEVLENTVRYVDSDNRVWLEISPNAIALKETVAGTEATLATASGVASDLETWYFVEIQVHRDTITLWRAEESGPAQFVVSASGTHTTTTEFAWSTGEDTAYAFDNLTYRDLPAQATLVMDGDKTISATFLAVDTTVPVITLLGNGTMSIDCGEVFTDPGATASDNRYGDITADIRVGGDVVDNTTPGTYVITYDVTDREGNVATQVSRTVTVTATDVSTPIISLTGDAVIYLALNATYTELGATATDVCDSNLPAVTVDNSAVDTSTYGEYTVTYNVMDGANNAAVEVTRTVRVWPTLTLSVAGAGTGFTTPADGTAHFLTPNSVVTIAAYGAPDSHFTGWSGDSVANSSMSETTITMDGAKSVTATFGYGYVVTLSVEGDGTLHYSDNGTPSTVTESGGPAAIVVDPTSNLLSLEGIGDSGVGEFWQWLSDDAAIDQTYVADSDFLIYGHTEIMAQFAPLGAIDRVVVSLGTYGNGTTIPAPGDYAIPRFRGTDLTCVEACQDDTDPLPSSCGPCEIATFHVEGVPDPDWVFWEWNAVSLIAPSFNAVEDIEMAVESNITGSFLERPGLNGLDLLGDLGDFLVEIGVNAAAADVYNLDVDWGDFWIDYDKSVKYKGDGMPDAAEFALLQVILDSYHLDLSGHGGVAHVTIWRSFDANRTQAALDLSGESDAVINTVAAYMTLGSYGHRRRIKALALEEFSVTLDLADYTYNGHADLTPAGDPDVDGLENEEEWANALASFPSSATSALGAFASAAIDGEDTGETLAKGMRGAKQTGGGAAGDCECPNEGCLAHGNLTIVSDALSATVDSAKIECSEEDFPLNDLTAVPLGREVTVSATAASGKGFVVWDAEGTLLDGSPEPSGKFQHVTDVVVTPVATESHVSIKDTDIVSVVATGEGITITELYGGEITVVSGPYNTKVTLTNQSGGGWSDLDEYETLAPTITVFLGHGGDSDLYPHWGVSSGARLKHTISSDGGGEVFASNLEGEDVTHPFLGSTETTKPNCAKSTPQPKPVFFRASANPGFQVASWSGAFLGLEMFTCAAATKNVSFEKLGVLTWDVKATGGDDTKEACIGYCNASPAKAYYPTDQIVQVTASAQPGYIFSHWEAEGQDGWTSATGDSSNWVVSGEPTSLDDKTENPVYVRMSDADGSPKEGKLTAVFVKPNITEVSLPPGGVNSCNSGQTGNPSEYPVDDFGNKLTIQCENGSYYFKFVGDGQEAGKCFRTCGDNKFIVEKITYPDGKWAYWGAFHSVRDNPCIAYFYPSEAVCDDDHAEGETLRYLDWRSRYVRFQPWDEWVLNCKKLITKYGTFTPTGLGEDCEAEVILDENGEQVEVKLRTSISDEDMGYLGPGNMICQDQFKCPGKSPVEEEE